DHDWPRTSWAPDASKTAVAYLLAVGDFAGASALARARIALGEQTRLFAHLMPLYLLDAAALSAMGNVDEGLVALRAALAIAIPGQFVRSMLPTMFCDLQPLIDRNRDKLSDAAREFLSRMYPTTVVVEAAGEREPARALSQAISDRERDVLGCLVLGMSNRQIADKLFISEHTVKMHVGNLLGKLGVKNRVSAVAKARDLHLIAR
ncbi:MAG: response regulator transcription factor, partial [Thermomicrobiales bacterium]